MTDHAKRLAEIEAHHAAVEARARGDMDTGDGMRAHEDRGDLLDMLRAVTEALATADVAFDACEVAIDNDGTVINRNALEGIAAYRALRGEGR